MSHEPHYGLAEEVGALALRLDFEAVSLLSRAYSSLHLHMCIFHLWASFRLWIVPQVGGLNR